MKNVELLKMALVAGAVFFFFGAVAHWFGLSLFPWYVRELYSPYHDSLIALSCLFFTVLLMTTARDPIKNRDTLLVIILGVVVASLFSIFIPFKIDFTALSAPAKKTQTSLEGVIGLVYASGLLALSKGGEKK